MTKPKFKIYFIVEEKDSETIEVIKQFDENLIINTGPPTYASCINIAYKKTFEPFFFLGADDIRFRENWLEEALACMLDPKIGVVGSYDPFHPFPDHSAHYLVRRRYITDHSGCMDIPNIVLYPYWHSYTDQEFIGVAKARKKYFYCETSVVEHIHPGWNFEGTINEKSSLFDETYAKGNLHFNLDKREFIERSGQWLELIGNKSDADETIERFILMQGSLTLQLSNHAINYCPRWLKKILRIHKLFLILARAITNSKRYF